MASSKLDGIASSSSVTFVRTACLNASGTVELSMEEFIIALIIATIFRSHVVSESSPHDLHGECTTNFETSESLTPVKCVN